MFKRLLQSMGVGGPSVDTVINNPNVRPGEQLDGQINIMGGDHQVDIEYVALGLLTRVEVESGDSEWSADQEFARLAVTGRFSLAPQQQMSVPFQFTVPVEAPITHVYGQPLHGMTMGLRTELEVARAIDKSDLDPFAIHPMPAQEKILEGLSRLGFRFRRADLEQGHVRGVHQMLPFYQEIEFTPAPQYAGAIKELELTFIATPQNLQVVLEIDKRGGMFTEGQDAFGNFTVDYASAEQTDWARELDAWLQRSAQRRGLFF
ncbi:MAG: sporulation-control protein [Actinomycetota bacterium]|nr:sporulation-control protein [Actinomycetota bacterium]